MCITVTSVSVATCFFFAMLLGPRSGDAWRPQFGMTFVFCLPEDCCSSIDWTMLLGAPIHPFETSDLCHGWTTLLKQPRQKTQTTHSDTAFVGGFETPRLHSHEQQRSLGRGLFKPTCEVSNRTVRLMMCCKSAVAFSHMSTKDQKENNQTKNRITVILAIHYSLPRLRVGCFAVK